MRSLVLIGFFVLEASCFSPPQLHRTSLTFEFPSIPYTMAIRHIHSPEHISETHRLGAPFFSLDSVEAPEASGGRSSVRFNCSTLVTKNMRVRMFSSRPSESNLLFFRQGVALYGVKFTVVPTRAFTSHQLRLDVTVFSNNALIRLAIACLLPVFMLINGLEDRMGFRVPECENEHLANYRRSVFGRLDADEHWALTREVLMRYSK